MKLATYDLKELRKAGEKAIASAQRVRNRRFNCDPINWGDLGVVSAERVKDDSGHISYRIWIEEAGPDCSEFPLYISGKLKQFGFNGIEVRTEW